MGHGICIAESTSDRSDPSYLLVAILSSAGYYIGAMLEFALPFEPVTISVLFLPNAILLSAFLVVRPQFWGWEVIAVFPAHLAAQMQIGVPIEMGLGFFISNCSGALLGAAGVRWAIGRLLRFDRIRDVIGFLVFCAFLAPFASSLLNVAFIKTLHWGAGDHLQLWRMRFLSDAVAILIIVPPLLTWNSDILPAMRQASRLRRLEGMLMTLALLSVGIVSFIAVQENPAVVPLLLYAPLPLLLWINVRFNPFFGSVAFLPLAFLSIWAIVRSHGPFSEDVLTVNVLSTQFILIGIAVPLMLFVAAIQERRQLLESLRQKNEKLNLALAAANLGTWDWDIQGKKGCWSPELRRMFGFDNEPACISPVSFLRQVHREDRAVLLRALRVAHAVGTPFELEFRIIRTNSELRWTFGKGAGFREKVGPPTHMLGVVVDITDRKLGEALARKAEILHESEVRFHQMADAIPQIVWAAQPDGYIDYANRKWHELSGLESQPEGDSTWLPFVHPDDVQATLDKWYTAVRTGSPLEIEHRLLFPGAHEYRWYLVRSLPIQDESAKIIRWFGTSTDIDAQKRAECLLQEMHDELELRIGVRTEELSRANVILQAEIEERKRAEVAEQVSEARFAKVFRMSPNAMCVSSGVDGPILDVNDRWLTLFKYDRAKVLGKTAQQLNLYVSKRDFANALKQESEPGYISDLDVEMRDGEMAIRNMVLSGGAIVVGKETCFITIIRDVTLQRQTEIEVQQQREQLTHLARAVMLGEFSGALAHQLNQPLAAILTNAQAARRFMANDPINLQEIREIFNDIVDEIKRACEVIRRMRALFMGSEPELLSLDLNEVVSEAIALARIDLITHKVGVTRQLTYDLGAVLGDRTQLQQVILNLIVNACQAMSSSGDDKRQLTFTTEPDGNGNIGIEVSDTGSGIPPEFIDKVFESFFTTKKEGLGLGLSISRSIVTAHGGHIEATNNLHGGTMFRIKLPTHRGFLS